MHLKCSISKISAVQVTSVSKAVFPPTNRNAKEVYDLEKSQFEVVVLFQLVDVTLIFIGSEISRHLPPSM